MENYFRVVQCPNLFLTVENHIYLNPLQTTNVSTHVSIKNFTFTVSGNPNIPIGSIGINKLQRKNLKIKVSDFVTIHAVNPAAIYPCHAMNFSVIRYRGLAIDYYSIDPSILAQNIQVVYNSQVFKTDQLLFVNYNNLFNVTCKVDIGDIGVIGEMLTPDTRITTSIESKVISTDAQNAITDELLRQLFTILCSITLGYYLFLLQYNSIFVCIAIQIIKQLIYRFIMKKTDDNNNKSVLLKIFTFCWDVIQSYIFLRYTPQMIFIVSPIFFVLYGIWDSRYIIYNCIRQKWILIRNRIYNIFL